MVSAASRLPSIVSALVISVVRAVGGDEVDDRRFVLEMAGEIGPALIGLEQDVLVGRLVELRAGRVQRRHAGVTAAGQVDGREVERQAEQVVAQRAGDELVDLVAGLPGHAADDGAGRDVVVDVASVPLFELRVGLRKPSIRPMWSSGRSDRSDRSTRSASSGRSDRPRARTRRRSRDRS